MKTRIITAIVGIIVLIGVMFTFNTLIFNLVDVYKRQVRQWPCAALCIINSCCKRMQKEGGGRRVPPPPFLHKKEKGGHYAGRGIAGCI